SALIQYRQAIGDARSPMVIGLAGNVINAFLAFGLIHGHAGLPRLGVAGAGLGTALTEAIEVSAMAVLFLRDISRTKRTASTVTLQSAIAQVGSVGGPTGLQFSLEALAFTAFTAVLGSISAREIAAHQVAMAVVRVSFLPGAAVAD